jgi:hypothetical protein
MTTEQTFTFVTHGGAKVRGKLTIIDLRAVAFALTERAQRKSLPKVTALDGAIILEIVP